MLANALSTTVDTTAFDFSVLAYALALAVFTVVSMLLVRADTASPTIYALMLLFAVRTQRGALAFLTGRSTIAMITDAGSFTIFALRPLTLVLTYAFPPALHAKVALSVVLTFLADFGEA